MSAKLRVHVSDVRRKYKEYLEIGIENQSSRVSFGTQWRHSVIV